MSNVLLVDDHSSFRQALAFMLGRDPELQVTAQVSSIAEARRLVANVDLAVVDLSLPDGSGIDVISLVKDGSPHAKVLVLSASADRRQTARAVEAGAVGVLHKSAPLDEIIDAVRRAAAGEQLISTSEVIEVLRFLSQQREHDRRAQAAIDRLTVRERDVLQALAEGLNDKDISEKLHISNETARTHMANILAKLGVESRLQALVFAVRHGAVRID